MMVSDGNQKAAMNPGHRQMDSRWHLVSVGKQKVETWQRLGYESYGAFGCILTETKEKSGISFQSQCMGWR